VYLSKLVGQERRTKLAQRVEATDTLCGGITPAHRDSRRLPANTVGIVLSDVRKR